MTVVTWEDLHEIISLNFQHGGGAYHIPPLCEELLEVYGC